MTAAFVSYLWIPLAGDNKSLMNDDRPGVDLFLVGLLSLVRCSSKERYSQSSYSCFGLVCNEIWFR